MDQSANNSVDEAELDQMIANIKGQATTPDSSSADAAPSDNSGSAGRPASPAITAADTTAAPTPSTPAGPTAPPAGSPPPALGTIPPPTPVTTPPAPLSGPPTPTPATPAMATSTTDLANTKHEALVELRLLIDRLTLPPEEKFNALLMMIRSTDDASLVPLAHAAARAIPDENHRAQALLNIIKEVDFFDQNKLS